MATPEPRPSTTTAAVPLLLRDATLPDGRRVDLRIANGRIAAIDPARSAAGHPGGPAGTAGATGPSGAPTAPVPTDEQTIDLGGALLAPAFVDGHIHLDKSFVGLGWRPHVPGDSIAERIAAERELLRAADAEQPIVDRAEALLRQVVGHGTGFLRTHVDVHPEDGLRRLEAVVAARDRCRALADVEIVAFPQRGVLRAPGTAALLEQALSAGATAVGGLDPAGFDGDVEGQLELVFGIAERHAAQVDIHLHDPGTLGGFELRRIAHHSEQRGMQGRVVVSHAYCLGGIDADELATTSDALARGGVAIMTNGPGVDPMPPVERLRADGVRVFAGTDNIRDAWWPYGDGDMLGRASMIGYRQGLYGDEQLRDAFALATTEAAAVLGIADYAIAVGARANLVVIEAPSVPEAVAAPPRRRLVLHDGRIVARDGQLAA